MKRFLVFAGDSHYPGGGWSDFKGSASTLEEAKDLLLLRVGNVDWFHVVDTAAAIGEQVVFSKPR